jgi:probable HAF family extracellular repeat protein
MDKRERGWVARVGLAVLAVALTGPQSEASKIRYEITDLGVLPGDGDSMARGLNNRGQVVGMSFPTAGNARSFLYSDGHLEELPGGDVSDISDAGQLARGGAFMYGPKINSHGRFAQEQRVVGSGGSVVSRVVIVEGDQVTSIPFEVPTGDSASPTGINDLGQVVGSIGVGSGARAFFYDGSRVIDVGSTPGGGAFAINNAGQVVGGAQTAFLYQEGAMTDLGTLGGDVSRAFDINELGQVVGMSGVLDEAPGIDHAFLYEGGTMLDLNDLIPPESGWILKSAVAINDLGQIAGTGSLGGPDRAFLLTPTTVPEPTALAVLGAAALAFWLRRHPGGIFKGSFRKRASNQFIR